MGRVREKRNVEKRRSEKKKNQKKENINIYYIFPIICGSGRSKNRFAKAAGAELSNQIEKLYIIMARNIFRNQNI
jgi:hypothetical protein